MSFRFFPRLAFLLVLCAFVSCSGKEGKESAKPAAVSSASVEAGYSKLLNNKSRYYRTDKGDLVPLAANESLPSGYFKRRIAVGAGGDTIFIADTVKGNFSKTNPFSNVRK